MARSLAAYDSRPFFERALRHGVDQGILNSDRVAQIEADLAKGMVQIARYFGTEYLRPELELALQRMARLMSLFLEHVCDGDLARAAHSLRDNSLLSHSKGGADLLRRLQAMPDSSLMLATAPTPEQQRVWLDAMTTTQVLTLAQYRAELAQRQAIQDTVDFARWLALTLGATPADVHDADALIRSAMLVLCVDKAALRLPTRTAFVQLVDAARRPRAKLNPARIELFFSSAPQALQTLAHQAMAHFVAHDLAHIRDSGTSADALLYAETATPFFIVESLDEDVSEYDRLVAKQWQRVTHGEADDPQVLAGVLLLIATAQTPKATLLQKDAKEITRVFRAQGFDDDAVLAYIAQHAPEAQRTDVLRFWHDDLKPEACERLADTDPNWPDKYMARALDYLRTTCRASWKARRA